MNAPVFACTLVFPPAFALAVALLLRLPPAVFVRDWLICAASATAWSLPPPWWPAADGSAVSLLTAAACTPPELAGTAEVPAIREKRPDPVPFLQAGGTRPGRPAGSPT